jgi:hypothetical protein
MWRLSGFDSAQSENRPQPLTDNGLTGNWPTILRPRASTGPPAQEYNQKLET